METLKNISVLLLLPEVERGMHAENERWEAFAVHTGDVAMASGGG
jgi:hypothetical protein